MALWSFIVRLSFRRTLIRADLGLIGIKGLQGLHGAELTERAAFTSTENSVVVLLYVLHQLACLPKVRLRFDVVFFDSQELLSETYHHASSKYQQCFATCQAEVASTYSVGSIGY